MNYFLLTHGDNALQLIKSKPPDTLWNIYYTVVRHSGTHEKTEFQRVAKGGTILKEVAEEMKKRYRARGWEADSRFDYYSVIEV